MPGPTWSASLWLQPSHSERDSIRCSQWHPLCAFPAHGQIGSWTRCSRNPRSQSERLPPMAGMDYCGRVSVLCTVTALYSKQWTPTVFNINTVSISVLRLQHHRNPKWTYLFQTDIKINRHSNIPCCSRNGTCAFRGSQSFLAIGPWHSHQPDTSSTQIKLIHWWATTSSSGHVSIWKHTRIHVL